MKLGQLMRSAFVHILDPRLLKKVMQPSGNIRAENLAMQSLLHKHHNPNPSQLNLKGSPKTFRL